MIETNKIYCGDVMEVLKTMPSESIDCCITSPPYWGLRDYGTAKWEGGDIDCDHIEKEQLKQGNSGGLSNCPLERGEQPSTLSSSIQYREICGKCGAKRTDKQIGLEKTPEEYVKKIVEVFGEVKRVLKNEGTLWLNLGDSYAGSGKGGNPEDSPWSGFVGNKDREESAKASKPIIPIGLKPKDLIGIPWRVAFALQADGWWLRQDIIWSKPNPMPESVTDRCTKSHEYVFLLTKSKHYYYDMEAIKEKAKPETQRDKSVNVTEAIGNTGGNKRTDFEKQRYIVETRNRRSVWTVATNSFPDVHFATFPEDLIEPMIKAGTSEKGICPDCGKAWERIIKKERIKDAAPSGNSEIGRWSREDNGALGGRMTAAVTLGWKPSCSCPKNPIPALVLDPFNGSGTTCLVARKLLRNYIGIELNPKYVEMAEKRLGKIPARLDKFGGN